ncbi:MAG: carboxypeptidase regulatory-like domain-containing protein [Acidobacteriaceae bacterium]
MRAAPAVPDAVLSQPAEDATPAATNSILSGTVVDPSDAAVTKAQVHVQSSTLQRDTTTDSSGHFSMVLAPGRYEVTIVSAGFDPYLTNVTLSEKNPSASIRATLVIATQAEEITVPSDTSSTAAADNKSALIFKSDQLKTFSDDDDTFQKQIEALAGSGDSENPPSIYVDGFSGGKFPPKNTIREIRINQNPYSAEYAELGYGRIEIFTKPGTDKIHGQFFMEGNDSSFNTSNPYVSVQPPYHSFNVFGDASGPIGKKTSLFLNIQYNDQQSNAIVDATTLDANLQPAAFSQAVANPTLNADYSGRLDRQVTPNNTLVSRYDYSTTQMTNSGVGLLVLPTAGANSTTTAQTLQVEDTQIIGTTKVSEAHFQYQRTRVKQSADSSAPSLNVEGAFSGGGSSGQASSDNQDRYEFQEIFTWQHGPKHFMRFGGRYRLLRDANSSTGGYNGQFIFPSLTAYQITEQGLAANETDAEIRATCLTTSTGPVCGGATQFSITAGQPSAKLLSGDLGVFAEDEWKLTKSITLDMGIRIETQSAIPDHFDPAPRIGFAWAIGQRAKKPALFVLRGGGGIFYNRFSSSNILTAIRQNGITQSSYYVTNPDFYPAIPSVATLSAAPATIYQISPHLRSEQDFVEGLSASRSLWKKGSISFNFLSWEDDHLWNSINVNAPLPGTYSSATGTGTYPHGTSQPIYQYQSGGTERLNRFYVQANVNPTKHLFIFAYYTIRQKANDTSGAGSFPSDSYDIHKDYGRSANASQRLYVGGFAQLKWGINFNAFLSSNTGTPYNITTGTDLNGDAIYNDRPAFATNPTSSSILYQTRYGSLDANPQPGEKIIPINYGTGPAFAELDFGLGRSFKFGPRDPAPAPPPGALKPKGPLPKPDPRYSLTFGLDAQNVFNDVNAGPPVGILTSPQFGHSISLNSPYGGASTANRVIMLRTFFSF